MISDPATANAILDRIVHRAHHIELKSDSLRKRHAVSAKENSAHQKEK